MKIYKKIEKHFQEILKIKTTPREIAFGFAIGNFIAILPTFGLGLLIGLGIFLIYKKMSKIAMFISFAVWNPLVLLCLYPLNYAIGDFLLKDTPVHTYKIEILNQIFVHSRRFLLGSFILSVFISIFSYFLIYYAAKWYQKNHPIEKVINYVEEIEKKIEHEIGLN